MFDRNPYLALGLQPGCTISEIKKSYKQLSLLHHPDRPGGDPEKFLEVVEAYKSLLTKTRDDADSVTGEEVEKPVTKEFDSKEVFEKFFAENNPFQNLGYDNVNFGSRRETVNVEVPLVCTLKEIYHGVTKRVKVSMKDGKTKVVDVVVKAGTEYGTTVHVIKTIEEGESDTSFIVTEDKDDKIFLRKGSDLIYTHKMNMNDCLKNTFIRVPTLNDEVIVIPVQKLKYQRVIPCRGLPRAENPKLFGNMIVQFKLT
ncbi:hypothetical protein CTEN210_05367 [Chaetoceros tenuissimus]|uniref:J domain-containing protein n=1 Tax=Chaetoceros tenuissimus TaxID=426638 RepID=A0AAD3CPU3_9STRA|nr:hypothetical protein CTEN210_05367 [Chaetoceros tenuissimus]